MEEQKTQRSFWIDLYDKLVLKKPVLSLVIFLVVGSFWAIGLKQFRLDASSDSLVLEHDEDLRYYREFASRYESEEFLVITFTPVTGLFSDTSLKALKDLRDDLNAFPRVSKVTTILDVPLFRSPPVPFEDINKVERTLLTPDIDRQLVQKEFSESLIYKNLLVSSDLKSTALIVQIKADEEFEKVFGRRVKLREKRYREKTLSSVEEAELRDIEKNYRLLKDKQRQTSHEDVTAIRSIIKKYESQARIFLGGVPMIVNDMLEYIRSDIFIFGICVALLMAINLWLIFRKKRWVILPMASAILSATFMSGILGWMRWDVTVVSSNFISLQLIMAMSFSIHLAGRYRELAAHNPDWDQYLLIREAVRTIFVPSSFTCLTTVAGFASLLTCDILPVIDFGWMMIAGLVVSLITTYLLIPITLRFLERDRIAQGEEGLSAVPAFFARLTERNIKPILVIGFATLVITILGMSRLDVENSFIKYFKKSTEIYRGMEVIDSELGGTTPLDVVLNFSDKSSAPANEPDATDLTLEDDDDFALIGEEEVSDPSAYWFTIEKLETIERVHDYLESQNSTGKVMSLATLLKFVRQIREGKPLNNFDLALIFNQAPDNVKKLLVTPYVSTENNEARIMVRMKDSDPALRRDQFLKKVETDLQSMGVAKDQFRLTGFMVLYNNMLQSLFRSQIGSSSLAAIPLLLMFILVFRSLKIGVIAMIPNLIATTIVLGFMGWANFPLDMMTITIVSISLGMGVEDTILYVHRFREEIAKDHDYMAAMRRCHLSVGSSMYHTSVVVTLGFLILVFSNFVPTILFGLFTAFAMVFSLTAALTLLPALIVLWKPFK